MGDQVNGSKVRHWLKEVELNLIYDKGCRTIFQETLEELSIRRRLSAEALRCIDRLS